MSGSGDYISREAAIKRFTFATLDCLGMEPTICASDVVLALQSIPAADVRPVVRTKWELHRENQNGDNWDRWVCPKCGFVAAKGWEHTRYGAKPKYNYCPNCGADMREES